MIHVFGAFELDEARRELRLRGRERPLQPRVFDLLVYLVRNRERVAGKDELLEALWPGVIVSEGSLQRVVSVARAALREGGIEDGIRTYPRRGYRFCADAASEPATDQANPARPSAGAGGREAFEQGDWERAAREFAAADDVGELSAPDLERWARALALAGRAREATSPLERAGAIHGAAGDRRGGAGVALLLAHLLFEGGEVVVARGWIARAASLLEGEGETVEQGHLAWLAGRFALYDDDLDAAAAHAERARRIGRRLRDEDLEALGLLYAGHALLARGEVSAGAAMHDEAAATVFAGGVGPWFGGLVYCGVIWGCRNRGDWQRASQWTDRFTRWCEERGLENFPGTCRLHRAEVLGVRGRLTDAEAEARHACDHLAEVAPWAHGDAHRVLGDLCLTRGELDRAEAAFRRARELGWDPQPGHALVLAARGHHETAIRYLSQALEDPAWSNRERRGLLLAALTSVAARAGRLATADVAARELAERPELCLTPSLRAVRLGAAAELRHARGRTEDAIRDLRSAIAAWTEVGAPLHIAEARLRLTELLVVVGDATAAEIELGAAERAYAEHDVPLLRRRCVRLRSTLGAALDTTGAEGGPAAP